VWVAGFWSDCPDFLFHRHCFVLSPICGQRHHWPAAEPPDKVSGDLRTRTRSKGEKFMHAVVRTGGKQYRVAPGTILEVEKLEGSVGDTVDLTDVLLVSNDDDVKIGQPIVDGATVTAKITGQHRGEKILVFRYRAKKRIRVRRGHRQYLTRLEIQSIDG